jgi:hypothetical protein
LCCYRRMARYVHHDDNDDIGATKGSLSHIYRDLLGWQAVYIHFRGSEGCLEHAVRHSSSLIYAYLFSSERELSHQYPIMDRKYFKIHSTLVRLKGDCFNKLFCFGYEKAFALVREREREILLNVNHSPGYQKPLTSSLQWMSPDNN